jgi:hypothetical protein
MTISVMAQSLILSFSNGTFDFEFHAKQLLVAVMHAVYDVGGHMLEAAILRKAASCDSKTSH